MWYRDTFTTWHTNSKDLYVVLIKRSLSEAIVEIFSTSSKTSKQTKHTTVPDKTKHTLKNTMACPRMAVTGFRGVPYPVGSAFESLSETLN